ncbi:MAG: hypothetical protein Q7O66_17460 [Dehalococcoidia bacterium]|nr:hypothetical protein [Dehalococcoidia bacterium]
MALPITLHKTGRSTVQTLTASTLDTAGAVTYTAAQMLGGLILRDPNGAGRTDVTPTAALLVAGLPVQARVNDITYLCHLINTANANETITVSAGNGVTLIPATVTVAQNENALLLIRFTDVNDNGTEAVTIYAMVAGG